MLYYEQHSNKQVNLIARSYNKIWKLMIDRKMNQTQLRIRRGCVGFGRNLVKICQVLGCTIDNILEFSDEGEIFHE